MQSSPTTEASISVCPKQDITNTALERAGKTTSMSFTRPASPEGKQTLFPDLGNSPTMLLWAAGPEDEFSYHYLGRGAFTVDLLCVPPVLQRDHTVDPTEAPSTTPPDVFAFTVSPTSAPTSIPRPPPSGGGGITSGALPGLLQAGGGLLGRRIEFVMAFGLFLFGVSTTSALL